MRGHNIWLYGENKEKYSYTVTPSYLVEHTLSAISDTSDIDLLP